MTNKNKKFNICYKSKSFVAISIFFQFIFILYFNERYFWITSMSSCSVYLARQIDIKKCDPDGFFA